MFKSFIEDGRSADIVQVRIFLSQTGIAYEMNVEQAYFLITSDEFKSFERQLRLRLLIIQAYHTNQDEYIGQLVLRFLEELGYDTTNSSTQNSPKTNEKESQAIYDGDMKGGHGFARKSGMFGSPCLREDYGDESFGDAYNRFDD